MSDFERRLSAGMHEATEDLRRGPDAWSDVRRRVRRHDVLRGSFAVAVAAALVAVAVVVVPQLQASRVEFEPAGPPAPIQTPVSPPARVRTPVPPPARVEVEVFFTVAGSADCRAVEAVTRTVESPAVLRGAVQELLAGPTEEERERGLTSFFSADTAGMLRDVNIADGVARIDFHEELTDHIGAASTACGANALLAQLDATVLQFPTVSEAVYALNGERCLFEEFLQVGSCG